MTALRNTTKLSRLITYNGTCVYAVQVQMLINGYNFQREFIYKDKQRDAVINTITKDFPLNVMYWAVREDGNFEIIDGQQRTISICQYVEGDFSVKVGNFPENRAFHNLQENEREQILNYKLMVYLCSGTDIEKLEWFKTVKNYVAKNC
jgi:hypothetical protein